MSSKRVRKKKIDLKGIKSLVSKNFSLKKIKINPSKIIEDTKNKLGKFYENMKK